MTELKDFIQNQPLIDTHEHLRTETEYVEDGPDILQDLFANYIGNDLIAAGAPIEVVRQVIEKPEIDLETRWNGIKDVWAHCQYTGYGEGVRLIAKCIYGIDELNLETIEAAAARNHQLRQAGERLRLLKEEANLVHVQIDDFRWQCEPDESGLDFFLYDLSWANFCNGDIDPQALYEETGIAITDINTLRQAMEKLFERYGQVAIAVKAQHAYERTLAWQPREREDTDRVLQKILKGEDITLAERLCLGDWGWTQGVELAIEYDLPFKIHTGYLAGNDGYTEPDRVRTSHFASLIATYPARFVLMHMSYPYSDEALSVAKHFPNVWLDLCWGWAINPYHAAEFVRRAIHVMPINKLFAFGGDTFWPASAVAYAVQARRWLTYALQGEINDGFLTESQAIAIAQRLMHDNQIDCFKIEETVAAIRAAVKA